MLHMAFQGEIYSVGMVGNHYITKIGNKYYDATGDVTTKYQTHKLTQSTVKQTLEDCHNYSMALDGPVV